MQAGVTQPMLGPGGRVGGRFQIEGLAGSGGMGIVYRAIDEVTGAVVALKVLHQSNPENVARFEREATTLAAFRHPNVVAYLAHGLLADDQPFLAMEWLDGEPLSARLGRGRLPVAEALALALPLAEALASAHAAGLVHRDIKPDNLLLTPSGVKLLDFGLARQQTPASNLTRAGTLVGTPGYMAPEQLRAGVVGPRSDVFALGCVLHECLCGQAAFRGDTFESILASVLSVEPPWLPSLCPEIPAELAALVGRMLRKDPAGRPADGGEVAALLRGLAAPAAPREVRASRRLPCSARLAWGVLADTDRWNRIVGSPRSTYAIEAFDGEPTRVGSADLFGLPSRWIEAGEWVEGAWGWGERRLLGGPMRVMGLRVEARDQDDGCEVELVAYASASSSAPEGALELIAARFEHKLGVYLDALEAFLRRAPRPLPDDASAAEAARRLLGQRPDRVLNGKVSGLFEATFEERARALLDAHPGEATERLVAHLRQAPDDQVRRLRVGELAAVLALEPLATQRALLQGTGAGLLDLVWEAVCPVCRVATHGPPSLASGRGSCALCRLDFGLDLATNLEATFRPARAVRDVSGDMFCGGTPAGRPHVVAQIELAPGQRRRVDGLPARQALGVRARKGELVPLEGRGEATLDGARWALEGSDEGGLWLENRSSGRALVTIERLGDEAASCAAATLLSCPEARGLLPAIAPELRVGVSRLVLLVAQPADLDGLLDEQGDAAALPLWRAHVVALSGDIAEAGGAVLQESGGALFASFPTRNAARVALRRAGERGAAGLRAALVEGPALVLSRPDGVELFGRTVRRALQALAGQSAGCIELTSPPASGASLAGRYPSAEVA